MAEDPGYGAEHVWKRTGGALPCPWHHDDAVVDFIKATYYKCTECGAEFTHFYGKTEDIYKAMQEAKIPAHCITLYTKAAATVNQT